MKSTHRAKWADEGRSCAERYFFTPRSVKKSTKIFSCKPSVVRDKSASVGLNNIASVFFEKIVCTSIHIALRITVAFAT